MGVTGALVSGFLTGRVALVTGSTGGIGEAVARCLASKGANVIINGFGEPDAIKKLVSSVQNEYKVDATYVGGDLSKSEDVEQLYKESMSAFPGGIDILVNNAGFQHVCPIQTFPLPIWNKMMSVMLTAPFHLIQLTLDGMKNKGWGRIINVSSAHGHVASPNKSAYVSVKHGILGLTKTVALEAAGSGVTCNALCPGYVETPLFIKQAEDRAKAQGISVQEGKDQILQVHPSGTPIKLDELAEVVAFLCSSSANQMTGTSMILDGGWTSR